MPIPIEAKALDDEAAAMMKRWYPPELWHRLLYGPDVKKGI
jgi:hypothetical protein